MRFRILIAEDEENLANTLALNLSMEDYQVHLETTGTGALKAYHDKGPFDLALLDVMLPGLSGFDICTEIRKTNPTFPIMILSAKDQIINKREGLRLGADDYITKPFDLEELLLRVSNLLRRARRPSKPVFEFEGGAINFETFVITARDGTKHTLSKREIGLLEMLTSDPGKVLSRDDIISVLWEPQENASSRTIDNYVLGFRKYFEKNPREPRHFHSIRGVGYKFTP